MEDTITSAAAATETSSSPAAPSSPEEFYNAANAMAAEDTSTDEGDQQDDLSDEQEIPQTETETITDPLPVTETPAAETAQVIDDKTWDSEIGAPKILAGPKGTKVHQYTEQQSLSLHQNSRFASELRSQIPDISIDSVTRDRGNSTDLIKITHAMRRGDPGSVKAFADMVISESGANPFAAGLTANLVQHLRTSNPAGFEAIKAEVAKDIRDDLYKAAQGMANDPDVDKRELYRVLAEAFHFHTNKGEVLPIDQFGKVDPAAAREADLTRREQELASQAEQQAQQRADSWTRAAVSYRNEGLNTEIEAALKPYETRFADAPDLFKMIKTSINKEVREKIAADEDFKARFNIEYEEAASKQTAESAKAAVNSYIARAKTFLNRELPRMLSSASNGAVQQNKQRHQQLTKASSSSHRVPGATGAPAKQSIAKPIETFRSPQEWAAEIDRLATA